MTSINHHNNLCLVTLPSPSPSAESAKLQSKLEALRKVNELCDFFTNLETGVNPSKNLLVNLCDGLQTFLGYDVNSKGYDGSGIVYSDLDRLCDAVMGFLSGVLSEVKNDPSVTTYLPVNKMTETLQTIKESMHNPGGLSKAVDAVSQALGEWDDKVTEKTKALTYKLNELKNNDISRFSVSLSKLNNLRDDTLVHVADRIGDCIVDAVRISQAFQIAQVEHIHLDPSLREKLQLCVRNIELHVEKFAAYASNTELCEILNFSQHRLERLHDDINKRIESRMNALADDVRNRVTVLGKSIHKVGNDLEGYVSELETWMKQAMVIIDDANKKIEAITNEAKEDEKGNNRKNVEAVIDEIDRNLGEEINNFETWTAQAGIIVRKGIKKCDEILQRVDKKPNNGGDVDIKLKASNLKTKAIALRDAADNAFRTVTQLVSELPQTIIDQVRSAVDYDMYRLKAQCQKSVAEYFVELGQVQWENLKKVGNVADDLPKLKLNSHSLQKWLQEYINDSEHPGYQVSNIRYGFAALKNRASENLETKGFEAMSTDALAKIDALYASQRIKGAEVGGYLEHFGKQKENVINKNINKFRDEGIATLTGPNAIPNATDFSKPFDEITNELRELTNLVNGEATDTLFEKGTKGVKTYLTDLQMAIGRTVAGTAIGLKAILKRFDDIKTKVPHVTIRLTELCSAINNLGYHAEIQLKDLKDVTIGKNLLNIMDKLHSLQINQIEYLMNDARKMISFINTQVLTTVRNVHSFVSDKIDHVTEEIRREARTLYHQKVSASFKTMITDLEFEIDNVIQKIKEDRRNGVKGLMMHMNDYKLLNDFKNVLAPSSKNDPTKFSQLGAKFEDYVNKILEYLKYQVMTQSKPPQPTDHSRQVDGIRESFDVFLRYLMYIGHSKVFNFTHESDKLLSNLIDSISTLSSSTSALDPQALPDAGRPVLKALKDGMLGFVGELGKGYVSRYDGGEGIKQWVKRDGGKEVLTSEGKNGAKVFLTLLETVNEDLGYLKNECKGNWSSRKIYAGSSLGTFLRDCGYGVPTHESKQNGELQCKDTMKGEKIWEKLHDKKVTGDDAITKHLKECESNELIKKTQKKKEDNFDMFDLLKCLHHHLEKYYFVNHMATFTAKKQPCSVFEMLCWLSGLPHNPVYRDLGTDGFDELFDKKDDAEPDSFDFDNITIENETPNVLTAYPQRIRRGDITSAIVHLTSYAPTVLTTILGTGDKFTTYACDFRSNHLTLSYPSRAEDCLHSLIDILRRMYPPLKFLHSQCDNLASEYGWSRCQYGKEIPSSKQPCEEHRTDESNCQPTSALMSYLGDCLPGHLPHSLTSIGCKAQCNTCPKSKNGLPCLTPLGFRCFSGSTRTGNELGKVLGKFFGNGVATTLLSLVPKPPSNLPEHFGFALAFVKDLIVGNNKSATESLKNYVEESITNQSIKLYADASVLTTTLRNVYGDTRCSHEMNINKRPAAQVSDEKCTHSPLSSLSMSKTCNGEFHCAPYLATLCSESYYYFAKKHADVYVSWAVYLPWDFWSYLNDLYNAFCAINCQDWGCRGCLRGDSCKGGSHGMLNPSKPSDGCQCTSIVRCKGVSPTLYKYGFSFGTAWTLHTKDTRKTCFDFRTQLHTVLHSQYFQDLFTKCDEYLREIRWPFMLTVLTLWLLSFLYLLHIMVIRLDLLHIKSHLNSPSSHRIAAQSLLAAARVNKLNKVFYLQP